MELNACIEELLDILKREIQSFNTVSELLILEEKSLIEFNTATLAENLEHQEDVFSSIACLEKSRINVLNRISSILGEETDLSTLETLFPLVDATYRKKLQETGHVLNTIYENIKKKKIANSILIKQGIILVESDIRVMLNVLGKTAQKKHGYSSKAELQHNSGGVCIDGTM
ncbi:flagellar protein FlgN [bacterium]|nr:flagellar protein FlgN [bacterium]